jgi:phosphatidylglycerol---prolipoprotein diacylglyceryl transferase
MYPVLFTIPWTSLKVSGYGVMMMAAFLISIWWAMRRAEKSGGNPDIILNCGFVALFAGVVGSRAMHVLHNWDQFSGRGSVASTVFAVIDVTQGGMEFYGGFMLAVVSVIAWLKLYEKTSVRWYMDVCAPSSALGLAIGRVGCLLNGCCWGAVCTLPWAVQFPFGSPAAHHHYEQRLHGAALPAELTFQLAPGVAKSLSRESIAAGDAEISAAEESERKARSDWEKAVAAAAAAADKAAAQKLVDRAKSRLTAAEQSFVDIRRTMKASGLTAQQIREEAARHPSLPVHPAQIYSTITALIVAFLMDALYWRRRRDGQVILMLLLIEPLSRWMIELLRVDNPYDMIGNTQTTSQGLATYMIALAALGLIALQFLPPRSRKAQIWTPPPDESAKPA